MGEKQIPSDLNSTPWEVSIINNENIRVFGITLGKTTIQDANQILASFPETRLIVDGSQAKLVAVYDELIIGGFIASIELSYALDADTLKPLVDKYDIMMDKNYGFLDKDTEMALLSTVINGLIYRPSIDYDIDSILQRFGQADSEVKATDTLTQLNYPDLGLEIIIDSQGPDLFKYQPLSKLTVPAKKPDNRQIAN
ncbi:MAG: hypothetical protein ACN4GM_16410 [Gammaproteobacteria bacterium]